MKFTTSIIAVLTLALVVSECSAQPPGRKRGEQDRNAAGQGGRRKQRTEGQQRPDGPGRSSEGRDPAQLVARAMKEFDKDGDSKLNLSELTAFVTAMRERRSSGDTNAQSGQRRGPGQKSESAGKGKPVKGAGGKSGRSKSGDTGTPGGEKPKRPAAE